MKAFKSSMVMFLGSAGRVGAGFSAAGSAASRPKTDSSSRGVLSISGAFLSGRLTTVMLSGVFSSAASPGRLILDRRGGSLKSSSLGASGVRSGTGLLAGRGSSPGMRSTSSMGSSKKVGPFLGFLARGPPEGKKERSSSPWGRLRGSSTSGTKKASSKGIRLFFFGAAEGSAALVRRMPPGWGMSSKCPKVSGSTSGTGAGASPSTDWMNKDFCFRAGRALGSEATSS